MYTPILPCLLAAALTLGAAPAGAAPAGDRDLAALREAARWPAPADTVVLSLASRLMADRRDEEGYRYFGERAAADPGRPLFLALEGLFQARMAGQVWLLRRVAWVEEAAAKLDRAVARDGGLPRVVRGLTLARLPRRFERAEVAVTDLRWALEAPGSPLRAPDAPQTAAAGLRRAAWQALAYAHATAGRAAESREALRRSGAPDLRDDAPVLATSYSVTARDGLRFGPPRVRSDGAVHLVTGYDFADIAFVVTSAGAVAIDAGTTPATARAALEAFRRAAGDLPVRAVLVTHAHWDHVGGLSALAGPGTEVVAQAGYRDELARVGQTGVLRRWFFGEGFRPDATLAFAPTRTIAAPTTLRFGDTDFELLPVRGGETDDALLVRLPASGVVFVGDAFMPYLGAPFLAEGSPEGLLDTIRTLRELRPARLVHGHAPLNDFFTAAALEPLGEALAELERETARAVREAVPLAAILDRNPLPAVLRTHPGAVLPFLVMRDQFVTRLQRQRTGYWQPDGEGLQRFSAAEWAAALRLLARGEERAFLDAARHLAGDGDDAMALELAQAGLASFPGSAGLRAERDRALDGLRARYQQNDPFRFLVYSELRGAELPPLDEPAAPVGPEAAHAAGP